MAVSETLSASVSKEEVATLEALEALDYANSTMKGVPLELRSAHVAALVNYIKDGNEALAACQAQAAGRIRMLEDALRQAVEVIKTWHNMDGSDVWDIYYRNAPEMKAIRDILGVRP